MNDRSCPGHEYQRILNRVAELAARIMEDDLEIPSEIRPLAGRRLQEAAREHPGEDSWRP